MGRWHSTPHAEYLYFVWILQSQKLDCLKIILALNCKIFKIILFKNLNFQSVTYFLETFLGDLLV